MRNRNYSNDRIQGGDDDDDDDNKISSILPHQNNFQFLFFIKREMGRESNGASDWNF